MCLIASWGPPAFLRPKQASLVGSSVTPDSSLEGHLPWEFLQSCLAQPRVIQLLVSFSILCTSPDCASRDLASLDFLANIALVLRGGGTHLKLPWLWLRMKVEGALMGPGGTSTSTSKPEPVRQQCSTSPVSCRTSATPLQNPAEAHVSSSPERSVATK